MGAPHPVDDPARLALLRALAVMDRAPEPALRRVVSLASACLGMPLAMLSFLDEAREWFAATVGVDVVETSLQESLGAHVLAADRSQGNRLVVVSDCREDPRFADKPLVREAAGIAFYAAVPVVLAGGLPLGVLCVADSVPRDEVDPRLLEPLVDFAAVVSDFLRLRMQAQPQVDMHTARDHLGAIIDSSDDAILSKSLDGTILSWNAAARAMFGYTDKEVVGEHMSMLLPADRLDEENEVLSRIARGETVDHFETERVSKDGTVVPVSLRMSPIKDRSGAIVAASTIARDVTTRQESDQQRFQLAALVDSSDDAILSKSLDGIILTWNAGAEKLYGYTREEIVGQHISVLVPPDRPNEVAEILGRIRQGGAIEHFDTERRCKDGTLVTVSVTISPIRDEQGTVVAASTIARDVTERKRLQALLEDARDEARAASLMKSEFLAVMSHEIRTPMNGVIGMTGLLLDTDLDPIQREYAETVRGSGEALLTIINDILDFSKIEAGKMDLEIIDFNLRDVLEDIGDLLAVQAHSKGLELSTLLHPDVPSAVRGDPGRLRQVLLNLAGNAVKFTRQGEVVIKASLLEETAADVLIRLEVTDTGIGIPADLQAQLFQPFSQADSSTTRSFGGTGLGLAISRQLVALMGGEIALDSHPGRGSTFAVTVRLSKQPADRTSPPPRRNLTGLRVLIVDDNATNRTILEHQTASWGMPNATAENGRQALEMLRGAQAGGDPYQVVLVDMEMPEMDGLQLAERIRSEPALAAVRLVLLTSSGVRGSAESARQAGLSAYLTKPVRQTQLYDCLTSVMTEAAETGRIITRHTITEDRSRQRPRLLVADDNPVNQKVAVAMLARIGYRTDAVSNGAEAVEAHSLMRYGAILMDCQMPEMDGFEATTEIRRREGSSSHVPIIALTAAAMKADRERCLEVGMDDYIAKPARLEHLAAVLARWVDQTPAESPPEAAPIPEETSELDVLDGPQIDELRDVMGGDEPDPYVGLADLFLEQLDLGLATLRRTAERGDAASLAREAHGLKGAAGNVGAPALRALFLEIEGIGKAGKIPGREVLAQLNIQGERYRGAVAALREAAGLRTGAGAPGN